MSANDKQVDGNHYQKHKIQHWDFCQDRPYLESRCMAYIDRHTDKNGLRDVLKAAHFLQKIAEVRYGAKLTFTLDEEQGQ
jgi:hypothetical protein